MREGLDRNEACRARFVRRGIKAIEFPVVVSQSVKDMRDSGIEKTSTCRGRAIEQASMWSLEGGKRTRRTAVKLAG